MAAMCRRLNPSRGVRARPTFGWTGLTLAVLTIGLSGCERSEPAPTPATAHTPTTQPAAENTETTATPTQTVALGDRTFTLELALDDATRFQGLSDRAFIAPDGGMLFVFAEPRMMEFVMRRCLVPIDIAFVDARGFVTATHAMQVEPYDRSDYQLKKYGSRYAAQFAIEVAGGTLAELGVRAGDRIDLPYADLKARAK